MNKLKNIFKYVIPYWGYAGLNILFNILSVIFSLFSFAFFIPILQMLFQTTKIPDSAPPINWTDFDTLKDNFYFFVGDYIAQYGQLNALMYISVVIIILFFLKNLFRYLAMFFLAPIRNGVVRDLRNALYHKILTLPLSYFSEQKKGDIISRMTADVQEIEWSIMSSLEMLFREPVTIITFIITLFIFDPNLTLFVIVLLPVSGLVIGIIGKSLRRTSQKGQKKMGFLISIIEETISGLRIIKAFTAIDYTNKKFHKENNTYTRLMIRLYRKRDLASPVSEFLGIIVIVVVLWYGGKIVLDPNSNMDAAAFIVYIAIVSQLLTPAKSITKAFYNIQKGAASVERIDYILDAEEVITEKHNALEKTSFDKKIEYKNVHFKYDKEEVLKEINLTLEKGKTIALVGPSGGGKSTMADLLPRFYDVTKGDIFIDSNNIKDIVIDDVRKLFGIVSQESILFNGSVFENIAFGLNNINEEEIIKASKIANAHEFIDNLENGYQTNIGDRGSKLSGGQKQRISIARAVLKNPPILILDEATSALDTESERLVQDALENLMKNRTSLVIAHRLSTIKNVDEVCVIQDGRIVEKGPHEELLKQNGAFKKLYDLQSFN